MPIVQYWHTADIPAPIAALFATFSEHNPDLRHYVFDEASANEFIAGNFTAREAAAFRACAIPAMQADYLRYCAVLVLGGVYSDADFRCIAPLGSLIERMGSGELFAKRTGHVTNQFFAFRSPGSPFLELALEIATANIENRIAEDVWLTTGPGIFTFMHLLFEAGAIDAFLRPLEGGPCVQYAKHLCDVTGDYSRIASAFDGIQVSPRKRCKSWVRLAKDDSLPGKGTDHWSRVKSSIFR